MVVVIKVWWCSVECDSGIVWCGVVWHGGVVLAWWCGFGMVVEWGIVVV